MSSTKEIWDLSPWANLQAKQAMDARALQEQHEVRALQRDLEEVHGQAVRDFTIFQRLIRAAFQFLHHLRWPRSPQCVAVDMGSGTGVGATILSHLPFVHKIYAVEFSEQFVDHIMPLTFEKFKAQAHKIVRVVGDFNRLRLDDASVDIVLDIDSFHHSENLSATLAECYRVLKPNGVVIAIDRGWPDHYTQAQLDAMLDVELNANLKRKYGIPPTQRFTRRDFGEHEYTLRQWEEFFVASGFETHLFQQRHPPALNRLWLRLPTLEATVWWSAWRARRGRRRHVLYGWGKTRILLVATKRGVLASVPS